MSEIGLGQHQVCWSSIHQTGGRLTARSREVWKPRDSGLNFSNRHGIWQAHRQHCCRDVCQISKRYDHYNAKSRRFETSQDLTVRRLCLNLWKPGVSYENIILFHHGEIRSHGEVKPWRYNKPWIISLRRLVGIIRKYQFISPRRDKKSPWRYSKPWIISLRRLVISLERDSISPLQLNISPRGLHVEIVISPRLLIMKKYYLILPRWDNNLLRRDDKSPWRDIESPSEILPVSHRGGRDSKLLRRRKKLPRRGEMITRRSDLIYWLREIKCYHALANCCLAAAISYLAVATCSLAATAFSQRLDSYFTASTYHLAVWR